MRKSNYSFFEMIYNVKCLIGTRLKYRSARFIRTPITVRGKKYIDIGLGLTTGKNCQIEVNGKHNNRCLKLGNNMNIGHNVRIQCAEKITIGNNVLIGSRVTIIDNSHGTYSGDKQDSPYTSPNDRQLKSSPIEIGDNVWIGENVVVLPGTNIGNGVVIGANSVVKGWFPDNVIIAGSPAKIIKRWDETEDKWERVR